VTRHGVWLDRKLIQYLVTTNNYEYKSPTDLHTLNVTITIAHRKTSVSSLLVARKRGLTMQRESYFRTGCLPQFSSSWRQALWRSRPEIFLFTTEPLRSYSLCTILSDDKMGLSLMNMLGLAKCTYSTYRMFLKFFLLQYTQILCLSRLC
jgi:hypothetical protein